LLVAAGAAPIMAAYPKAVFFLVGAAIDFLRGRRWSRFPRAARWLSLPALAGTFALLTVEDLSPVRALAACVPAFVFFQLIVEGDCPLSSLLRWRGLQYMGTISYSFYLWSAVVTYPMKLFIVNVLSTRVDPVLILAGFAAVGFAASIAIAHISFLLLEEKLCGALRARARGA